MGGVGPGLNDGRGWPREGLEGVLMMGRRKLGRKESATQRQEKGKASLEEGFSLSGS